MKTFPAFVKDQHVLAFEVRNTFLPSSSIVALLKSVEGVSEVTSFRLFSRHGEIRAEFKYKNLDFIVVEPFNDNSRYWVGPKDMNALVTDIGRIESAFQSYKPIRAKWRRVCKMICHIN